MPDTTISQSVNCGKCGEHTQRVTEVNSVILLTYCFHFTHDIIFYAVQSTPILLVSFSFSGLWSLLFTPCSFHMLHTLHYLLSLSTCPTFLLYSLFFLSSPLSLDSPHPTPCCLILFSPFRDDLGKHLLVKTTAVSGPNAETDYVKGAIHLNGLLRLHTPLPGGRRAVGARGRPSPR